MGNVLEYAEIFQDELDYQMNVKATSGWMELNSELVQYNGGNEVKIASITMDGLANYSRKEGFPSGSINLAFETHKLTMDRARTFSIDAMDVNETNFLASAANILASFQSDCVIPEVDAYRYSKIAAIAIENGKASTGYTPTSSTIWEKLNEDIATVQDIIGEDKPLVITMSTKTSKVLNNNEKISKRLDVMDFSKGDIFTKVQSIDGIPIISVPSARLYSEYIFKTGEAGQEEGGFEKSNDAKAINWIITARNAPIAVSKTEKVRIFEPNQNIKADAFTINYRKYHDLWITSNKLQGIFVNLE